MGDRILVMGSCRLAEPMKDVAGAVLYPGGHVHASGEFIQAVRIMKGEIEPPPELHLHIYRGWGVAADKRVDLAQFDTVAVELCSLKNYVYGDWLLHVGYDDFVELGELPPLDGVELRKETYEEVIDNLDRLQAMIGDCALLVVLQNNLPALAERYVLGHAASEWCRRHSRRLIDATAIIAEHGVARCLPVKDGEWDFTHYTDFMKAQVREAVVGDTGSRAYEIVVPDRVRAAEARKAARTERAGRLKRLRERTTADIRAALGRVPGVRRLRDAVRRRVRAFEHGGHYTESNNACTTWRS